MCVSLVHVEGATLGFVTKCPTSNFQISLETSYQDPFARLRFTERLVSIVLTTIWR